MVPLRPFPPAALFFSRKVAKDLSFEGGLTRLTALTVVKIGSDLQSDGASSASSIVDIGILAATGVAVFIGGPVVGAVAAGVLIYGILDYSFDIGGKLDQKFKEVELFDYD